MARRRQKVQGHDERRHDDEPAADSEKAGQQANDEASGSDLCGNSSRDRGRAGRETSGAKTAGAVLPPLPAASVSVAPEYAGGAASMTKSARVERRIMARAASSMSAANAGSSILGSTLRSLAVPR